MKSECSAEICGIRCTDTQVPQNRSTVFPGPKHALFFFPEECDLNSTCVLCAEGTYYFQTYKYPYIYYTKSLSRDSENNHEDDFSGIDDDFLDFYDE